jgi:hypothetical protein
MRTLRAAGLVAALALAATTLVTAPAATADSRSPWAAVRQATTQFHDVAAAEDAGYVKFLPCFEDPSTDSGMGQHWADLRAIGYGIIAPTHPEVLVYEPHNGKYQLVAVEYVLPPSPQYTDANPPELFGAHYHFEPGLQIWALHAYLWRGNPTGINEDFSPNVRLCPPAAS